MVENEVESQNFPFFSNLLVLFSKFLEGNLSKAQFSEDLKRFSIGEIAKILPALANAIDSSHANATKESLVGILRLSITALTAELNKPQAPGDAQRIREQIVDLCEDAKSLFHNDNNKIIAVSGLLGVALCVIGYIVTHKPPPPTLVDTLRRSFATLMGGA